MNYFAFETNLRAKLKELVAPILDQQLIDRKEVAYTKYEFKKFGERLKLVEGIFEDHKGKNVVFDQLLEKMTESECEHKKFVVEFDGTLEKVNNFSNTYEQKFEIIMKKLDKMDELLDNMKI